MKALHYMLLFLLVLVTACEETEQDEINTPDEPFFSLGVGDYWKYSVEELLQHEGDTTVQTKYSDLIVEVEKDTLLQNDTCFKYALTENLLLPGHYKRYFDGYENGNYYHSWNQPSSVNGINGWVKVNYFKDSLNINDEWSDTVEYYNGNMDIYKTKVIEFHSQYSIDSLTFNDVFVVRQDLPLPDGHSINYYARGIGKIKEDFGSICCYVRDMKITAHNK